MTTDTVLTFLSDYWISLVSILALVVLSAFFSGSETSLTALNAPKLRERAMK